MGKCTLHAVSRWDWLNERGPAYLEACKNGSKSRWLDALYDEWFAVYHVSLAVDVEPVPGATYPEPVDDAARKEMETMLYVRRQVRILTFHFRMFFLDQLIRL